MFFKSTVDPHSIRISECSGRALDYAKYNIKTNEVTTMLGPSIVVTLEEQTILL